MSGFHFREANRIVRGQARGAPKPATNKISRIPNKSDAAFVLRVGNVHWLLMGHFDAKTLSGEIGIDRSIHDGRALHGRHIDGALQGYRPLSPGLPALFELGDAGLMEERPLAAGRLQDGRMSAQG